MRPNIRSVFVKYTKPFIINENTQVDAYALKGTVQSKIVSQHFFKVPDDKSIIINSKVHPMYTAGGADALIDGIMGSVNWKTGEWQSYYSTDFNAIIDLKTVKQVNYTAIHVLQDVSPWIVFPKELIIETSKDGKQFTEVGRIRNTIQPTEGNAKLLELGSDLNVLARYIWYKAINGGPLPAWHESAGNPSHLFIDEIIVR